MKYMLDTNICIYVIKHNVPNVIQTFLSHQPNDLCISSITYAELVYGVQKSSQPERNMTALVKFLSSIQVVDFDAAVAFSYGQIRADLERKGTPIGNMDMLIAAHALSRKLTLVTNNTGEFLRVFGLSIENWAG